MNMKKSFNNLPVKLALTTLGFASLLGVPKAGAQAIVSNPGTSAITPVTQTVEQGPILDVVPYVLADGYTINLALIPSDTEFTGYAASPVIPQVAGNLNVVQIPTVLPTFTVRQVVTTVNVWDNQTVVLGGLITSTVLSTKNKVPIAGDLPLFGRLFQSNTKQTAKDNLIIFVTATIVDPAGNRVHTDDDLPFAQSVAPAQPAGAGQPLETEKRIAGLPDQNQ
jgi:general secretion pathway protein D